MHVPTLGDREVQRIEYAADRHDAIFSPGTVRGTRLDVGDRDEVVAIRQLA